MRERYRCIARVVKPHGRFGEVVTVPVHGLPSLLSEGLDVFVVPPLLHGERSHSVLSCSQDGREGSLVSLSGVEDISAADELRGRYLLSREADLPEGWEAHDVERLVGREVRDGQMGSLGTIEEIMVTPANDVWVVRQGSREVLLPVVDAVVEELPDQGPITVDASGFLSDWGGAS